MLAAPTFTPINSLEDIRLVTLIAVTMRLVEELALKTDSDPDCIFSEELYLATKRIHSFGTDCYLQKLVSHYPLLVEAIN
jgi:hypothetical protein